MEADSTLRSLFINETFFTYYLVAGGVTLKEDKNMKKEIEDNVKFMKLADLSMINEIDPKYIRTIKEGSTVVKGIIEQYSNL